MVADPSSTPTGYEVWRRAPLVVGAAVDDVAAARRLAAALTASTGGDRFIGIVGADVGEDVGARLTALAPVLAELIFTASSSPEAREGDSLAWEALELHGVGQDFVFTVPELGNAIRYALDVLAEDQHRGWEGSAVLIAGGANVVDEARQLMRSIPSGDDGEGGRPRAPEPEP